MYTSPTYLFTRPNDTTQYSANDLVANSTTANQVVPLRFNVERLRGAGRLFHVRIWKSTATVTQAKFNLHLYTQSPTVTNGDNGAFAVATTKWWFTTVGLDMSSGNEVVTSVDIAQQFTLSTGLCFDTIIDGQSDGTVSGGPVMSLFGLVEVQTGATYTPGAQEQFKLTLGLEGNWNP